MLAALCRFVQRLFDWPDIDWSPPLTRPAEPVRPWGLESDRRVGEEMGPPRRFPSTPESRRIVREVLAETRKGAQTKEVRDLIDKAQEEYREGGYPPHPGDGRL